MARSKEFIREDILDKAIELFSSRGYNGSSMEDVTNHTGLSRSSLYDTFGDKRGLYIAALERYRSQASGDLIALANNSTDAMQTIKKIFSLIISGSLDDEFFKGCFMINSTVELAPHDKEIGNMVAFNMQAVEDALYKLIKRGQDAGQLTLKHNARSIARFLFNTISGLRVAAKAGAGKKVFEDILKVTLSVLTE
ncbi:MAG: TetR/AcrR family transcriptional regulator [Ferruginibacter sp.]